VTDQQRHLVTNLKFSLGMLAMRRRQLDYIEDPLIERLFDISRGLLLRNSDMTESEVLEFVQSNHYILLSPNRVKTDA
jgi:hypothetical protein